MKALRVKFILVAMGSIFGVLSFIVIGMNIMNYRAMVKKADQRTFMLAENNGHFPRKDANGMQESQTGVGYYEKGNRKEPERGHKPENMSPETPFETRYFTLQYNTEGALQRVDCDNIAAVSETEAEQYGKKILKRSGKKEQAGFYDTYRYRVTTTNFGTQIIFVDCMQDLMMFSSTLRTSILVSFLGLLAVLLLVVLFSKMVFAPVAESYRKQRRFITDASHEIKTPLTVIDANTEVLEMLQGESEWTKSTKNQVQRLTTLANQLVMLSRMEEQEKLEKQPFSFTDAVLDCAGAFVAAADTRNKKIAFQVADGVELFGNEAMIRQLIGILVENAVKYADTDAVIQVGLKQKGKRALFYVENDAAEIKKGDHRELFERFYRTDASRNSKTGGSGIGLSVARSIVEAHHGKITANSEQDGTIRFQVLI